MDQFIAKIFEMGGISMVSVGLVYLFLNHDAKKNKEIADKDIAHERILAGEREKSFKVDAEVRKEYADKLREVTEDCHRMQSQALDTYVEQIKEVANSFKESSKNSADALTTLTEQVTEKLNFLHDDLLYFIEECECGKSHRPPARRKSK